MKKEEFFSSRWTLILSVIGIAVGTGNIWRFSRVVAQNGGGSFLIPWLIFLLIWSIPLIITEFALGRFSRNAPIGAISKTAGSKFAWMGGFIAFTASAIMFYYSVVTGWCLKYFFASVSGSMNNSIPLDYWNQFSSGIQPLFYHLAVMSAAGYVIFKGVTGGIEKVSKILVPSLLIILFLIFLRGVTLPGAFEGIKYFFTPDLNTILDYKVWLNALTQNAWDTGAGWGLILTYAVYMKRKEEIPVNAALIGFGNNSVSLMAGITIFSTVFALSSGDPLSEISTSGPANTGLTFIYLPILFAKLSSSVLINQIFASAFFLALFFAAFTSLLSMVELATRTFIDFGMERRRSIIIVSIAGFLLGIPSSLNINFLINQDWVWGVGLILSGAFISFAVIRFGVNRFREELVNRGSQVKIGRWYNFLIGYLIPLQVIILITWWLTASAGWDPDWLNPFHAENAGTCLFQWGLILFFFIIMNKKFTSLLKQGIKF